MATIASEDLAHVNTSFCLGGIQARFLAKRN